MKIHFIKRIKDKIFFKKLSKNTNFELSLNNLNDFKNYLNWKIINKRLGTNIPNEFIEPLKDYLNWENVSKSTKINFTRELIDKYKDKWVTNELVKNNKYIEYKTREGKIKEYESRIRAREEEIATTRNRIATEERELEEGRNAIKSTRDRITREEQELATERNTITTTRDRIARERNIIENTRAEIAREGKGVDEGRKAIESTRDRIAREERELEEGSNAIESTRDRIAKEERELEEGSNTIKSARDRIAREERELENRRNTIKSTRDRIPTERNAIEIARAEIARAGEALEVERNAIKSTRDRTAREGKELGENEYRIREIRREKERQRRIIEKDEDEINRRREYIEGIERNNQEYIDEKVLLDTRQLYVNYDIPQSFVQDEDWKYAVAKFPTTGIEIMPYRKGKIASRGYTEPNFEEKLRSYLPNNIEVLGEVNVLTNKQRPYEPDIAIIYDKELYNIRIDVEIDEPYCYEKDPTEKTEKIAKPIHYVGCGDDFRDAVFNSLGWIVVRFSEKQVHCQQEECICYIAKLINAIDDNFQIPNIIKKYDNLQQDIHWSETEAQEKAANKEREKYLNDEIKIGKITKTHGDITITKIEEKIISNSKLNIKNERQRIVDIDDYIPQNILQDKEITFSPQEHIYYNTKTKEQYTPVSTVYGNFFSEFDAVYWAKIKAPDNPGKKLEEWNCKGKEASEVGTFLHEQINHFFLQKEIEQIYNFEYKGKYIQENKNSNILKEYRFFQDFYKNMGKIKPFRTEWPIFDRDTNMAGTIDFIAKDGDDFILYDWKRSKKIIDEYGNIIKNPFQNGINGMEHLSDCSYCHYCLQQNLYRYILEKDYGLKVKSMNLVVLHPEYDSYKIVKVPIMNKEIETIINTL